MKELQQDCSRTSQGAKHDDKMNSLNTKVLHRRHKLYIRSLMWFSLMVLSSGVFLASVGDALLASVCDVTHSKWKCVVAITLGNQQFAFVQLPGEGSHDGNSTSFCRTDIDGLLNNMNTSTVYGAYTGLTDEMCVCTRDLTSLQEIAISHHYLKKKLCKYLNKTHHFSSSH